MTRLALGWRLSVCGVVSAAMNFAGRRLGWLRRLGLLVVIAVAGGLLAPVACSWTYRTIEVQEWQRVAQRADGGGVHPVRNGGEEGTKYHAVRWVNRQA